MEKVKSREWHQMQLTANKGLGQRVESFLEMQRMSTIGVDRSGRGGGTEQRNEKSLEEVVDSLMDWNRVFDVAGDVDDEINDLKQQNLTVISFPFTYFHFHLSIINKSDGFSPSFPLSLSF